MLKHLAAKAGVVAASAALFAGVGIGNAQASTYADYIGDGYANNPHAVWCVQHLYNDWAKSNRDIYGYATPDIPENGEWGLTTKNAVMLFQSWFGFLTVDGIVGPRTGVELLDQDSYYGGQGGYCFQYIPSTSWY